MKQVAKLYESSNTPVLSFEFFPPRDDKAAKKFDKLADDLAVLKPDYMSVTFGAGGSTIDGSYQTVKKLLAEKTYPTVAYIAGYGLGPDEIKEVLDKYQDLGVETIFVIRGDEPRDDRFSSHSESFTYASEMIAFIKNNYNFTLGCAAYPEGHIQAVSLEKDIEYLKLKVDNGAAYAVCQYCYNNNYYFEFREKCSKAGINVPIVPGIMPVYTVKLTQMLAKVCGSKITDKLKAGLDNLAGADKDDVLNFGIDFALQQCRELLKEGVPGLHIYTMNRSKSTLSIINQLREEKLI